MTREALLDLAAMLNRLGGDLRAEARRLSTPGKDQGRTLQVLMPNSV
jgi:hypothetical protein